MKFLSAILIVLMTLPVFASDKTQKKQKEEKANVYAVMYIECIGWGLRDMTKEEKYECHVEARKTALSQSKKAQAVYLDCIDYGHSYVSPEKDIKCTVEASKEI